jgi:hypothetical protein
MSEKIGLWIDHRKVTSVHLNPEGERVETIASDVEKHSNEHGVTRGGTAYYPEYGGAGDQEDRRYPHHLNEYYGSVVDQVKDAESILVIGPGEANREFSKRFERNKALAERLANVITVDKMAVPQIFANARKCYQE